MQSPRFDGALVIFLMYVRTTAGEAGFSRAYRINLHRNLERCLNLSEDLPEAERINDNTADQNVLT